MLGKTEDICFFYFVLYISCWLGLVVSCPCMVLLSSSWLQTPCVHAACLPPAPHPENTQPLQGERSECLHVAVVSALPTCSHVPDPGFSHQRPSAGRTVCEIPRPLCITDVTAGTPERPVMVEKTHYTTDSNMLLLVFPLGAFDEKDHGPLHTNRL